MGKERDGMNSGHGLGRGSASQRVPGEVTPDVTDARAEMDDQIIKSLCGTASPFEEGRLKRWRESTPENEEYFLEMVQVWELTAPEPKVSFSSPPTVEEILSAVPIPIDGGNRPALDRRVPVSRRWRGWGLLAASVASVGLGIRLFGFGAPDPTAVYEAAQGGSLDVTLEDGSFVRLASGSTLQEWDVEDGREVSLDGRAFFAVARDEERPFVVRVGIGEVRVLGTRFQVDTEGDEVEAVVVEGLVRLTNEDGSVETPAGSIAWMGVHGAPRASEVDDVYAFLDWPEGILVFQATPLAQVVAEVSRHFGRALRIDGPGLPQRRITAWFQAESFEAVAESLCVVTEAVCQTDGETVTMGTGESGEAR